MWYNKTEVATKEELETVKGMIEVSARLIAVYGYDQSENTVDISCDFDYIKIICTYYRNISDTGRINQESIRYLIPGGICIIPGSSNTGEGFGFAYNKITLIGHTLSFYSSTRNNLNLTTEARMNNITIEVYKY